MLVAKFLVHKADLYRRSTTMNENGEHIYSLSKSNMLCFVWGGKSKTRVDSQPQSSALVYNFKCTVGKDDALILGDQLRNVRNVKNVVLFPNLEVIGVNPIDHRSIGILFYEIDLLTRE